MLGIYAQEHDPTAEAPYSLVFTSTIQLKVWFATAAVALAVVQVLLGDAHLREDAHPAGAHRRGWVTPTASSVPSPSR